MKNTVLLFGYLLLFGIWNLGFGISKINAIYDPLTVPNNRHGIHVFDPSELTEAAKLINSTGGEWGYITVPIRSNDRDKDKWVKFMNECKSLKIIPIIRLSTYPIGTNWEKPNYYDLVDFVNFLSDLPWPIKNRYIILFNEPNHHFEWGGEVNPKEYAEIVTAANDLFKSRSSDYFLLSAGMDMSAPNSPTSKDALQYYKEMFAHRPNWYDLIDGISTHAYPNPGFIAPPTTKNRYGILSYRFEQQLFASFKKPKKPIFITETGTKANEDFLPFALTNVWTDTEIVAITPFVFFAASGDFAPFSFLDTNHKPNDKYFHLLHHPKIAGKPWLSDPIPKPQQSNPQTPISSPPRATVQLSNSFYAFIQKLFFNSTNYKNIKISDAEITVEIADTPAKQTQGLSGRPSLDRNSGMLFKFPTSQVRTFWMKDMQFPLDFVWINSGKVVELTESVPSPTEGKPPLVFSSKQPVDMVLELNAGETSSLGIEVGDLVNLNP